jgi:hypothetical protein
MSVGPLMWYDSLFLLSNHLDNSILPRLYTRFFVAVDLNCYLVEFGRVLSIRPKLLNMARRWLVV